MTCALALSCFQPCLEICKTTWYLQRYELPELWLPWEFASEKPFWGVLVCMHVILSVQNLGNSTRRSVFFQEIIINNIKSQFQKYVGHFGTPYLVIESIRTD